MCALKHCKHTLQRRQLVLKPLQTWRTSVTNKEEKQNIPGIADFGLHFGEIWLRWAKILELEQSSERINRWGSWMLRLIEIVLIYSLVLQWWAPPKHIYLAYFFADLRLHCDHCSLQLVGCQSQAVQAFFTLAISVESRSGLGKQHVTKRSKTNKACDSGWNLSSLVSRRATTIFPSVCLDAFGIFNKADWRGKHLLPAKKLLKWMYGAQLSRLPCMTWDEYHSTSNAVCRKAHFAKRMTGQQPASIKHPSPQSVYRVHLGPWVWFD